MSALELLTWARGPGLAIALAICAFGILLRLFEIFSLGRKADLSRAREHSPGSGWRTIFSRSLPPPGLLKRAPVTYIVGYVFHLGVAITLPVCVPHVELAVVQPGDYPPRPKARRSFEGSRVSFDRGGTRFGGPRRSTVRGRWRLTRTPRTARSPRFVVREPERWAEVPRQ